MREDGAAAAAEIDVVPETMAVMAVTVVVTPEVPLEVGMTVKMIRRPETDETVRKAAVPRRIAAMRWRLRRAPPLLLREQPQLQRDPGSGNRLL